MNFDNDDFGPRAYRISEVCKITGLGRTTVYAAIKSGALKALKCGRRTLILASAVEAWFGTLPPAR
jgi:excisionase family DNA binding protein